jgi:hypothetical protein
LYQKQNKKIQNLRQFFDFFLLKKKTYTNSLSMALSFVEKT